jgi:chromatin remodeling complex protein RSC6
MGYGEPKFLTEEVHTMPKPTRSKKPTFGGYSISFQGRSDSLESLFGATPIGPAEMTKKLWTYVKRRGLATKR